MIRSAPKRPPLFLFYEEPDPDRWFSGDRHFRKIIRRIVRGPHRPGGVMRWYLNLRAGLDELGVSYRINDYRGLARTPGAWAHVVGQQHVIQKIPSGHPIIFGPAIPDHPCATEVFQKADIRALLIPCDWFKAMYDRDLAWSGQSILWPAGIDTRRWSPPAIPPAVDEVLLYDKIRWERDHYEPALLEQINHCLTKAGLKIHYLRYGSYKEEDYCALLKRVGSMVFLCEHETQGFAYLQALSSGVPILAWDRGGFWKDPNYYPDLVQFSPVSSIPYFDPRCGDRFNDFPDFVKKLPAFVDAVTRRAYRPRDYVLDNLTLAARASAYLELSDGLMRQTPD